MAKATKSTRTKVTVAQLAKQAKTSPRRIRRIARKQLGTGERGTERAFTERQANKVLAAL